MTTIAERIAEVLSKDPRTLVELTAATGVDGAILSRVARGVSTPSLHNAERIAAGLGYRLELVKASRTRRASKGRA